jgi:glycerol-3-phosphate cytidylyltransferase
MLDRKEIAKKMGKDPKDLIIGFTASTFDLGPHAGHCVMLRELADHCDFVIVGLLTDPTNDRADTKNKPVQSIFERYVQLSSNRYVDEVVPFESEKDLEDMLLTLMPDIRFVGDEYKDKSHTGKNITGIKIIYNKRKHSFSTSELRKRVVEKERQNR